MIYKNPKETAEQLLNMNFVRFNLDLTINNGCESSTITILFRLMDKRFIILFFVF